MLTSFGNSSDIANALTINFADDKILVAGDSIQGTSRDFALVRYNANGTLDTDFGTGGKVITDVNGGSQDYLSNIVVQTDGKIVLIGSSIKDGATSLALVRYDTDGKLDTSFGAGGKVVTSVGTNLFVTSAVIQSNDRVVVGGTVYQASTSSQDLLLVRYDTDGKLDTTFGGGTGKVVTDVNSGSNDTVNTLAIGDGKIVVGAYSINTGGGSNIVLVRYEMGGTADTSFGGSGKVTVANLSTGSSDNVTAMALQSNGKIVIGGYTIPTGANPQPKIVFERYTTTGALDTTFGTSGKILTTLGTGNTYPSFMVAQPDDKLLVLVGTQGFSGPIGTPSFVLARYTAAGTLDNTFGTSGQIATSLGDGVSIPMSMALQRDGSIVVVGSNIDPIAGTRFATARYQNDLVINHPPVANAGGPYSITTGQGLTLNGSGSSDPDTAQGDKIVSYAWDVNGDGVTDFTVTTPTLTLSAAQLSALGLGSETKTLTVRLTVTDTKGASNSATASLTITVTAAVGPRALTVTPATRTSTSAPMESVTLTFSISKPVDPTTLIGALSLKRTVGASTVSVPLDTNKLTVTQVSSTVYRISGEGLKEATTPVGNYALSVIGTLIKDTAGVAGTGTPSASWTTTATTSAIGPKFTGGAAAARSSPNVPVKALTLNMDLRVPESEPDFRNYRVNPVVLLDALSLTFTYDGGTVTIPLKGQSGVSISLISNTNKPSYRVNGLDKVADKFLATYGTFYGEYKLQVDGTKIVNLQDAPGAGTPNIPSWKVRDPQSGS